MFRKDDCQAYRKWKEERSKKSKQTRKVKKRKRKEPTADCIDEDEIEKVATKPVLKFNYRKCKEKKKGKKKKRTGQLVRKIYKRVSFADLVLRCIKPTVEEREHLLNPRHANCLGRDVSLMDFTPRSRKRRQSYMFDRRMSGKTLPCWMGQGKKLPCKKLNESESEDSDCDSICSFDSEICLKGVTLTAKDKEEIRKHEREARRTITNEEN